MTRKFWITAALVLGAGLMATSSTFAQPFGPRGFGPGPRGFGPGPGPLGPFGPRPMIRPPLGPFIGGWVRPAPPPPIMRSGVSVIVGSPAPVVVGTSPAPVVVDSVIVSSYRVVYREPTEAEFRTYRVYKSERIARDIAEDLQNEGYDVRVLTE